jgi:hypothetical protein
MLRPSTIGGIRMASNGQSDDLPAELEFLRGPALQLVGSDRQIISCAAADFDGLERALRWQTTGLTSKQAAAKRARQRETLRAYLAQRASSDEPLVVGLRFVAELLHE